MSTITVKDGTTIFRTVSATHPDLVYRDLPMSARKANRSRDREAIRP